MKKIFFIMMAALSSLTMYADNWNRNQDSLVSIPIDNLESLNWEIEPTYLEGALVGSPWKGNWFVQATGAASAFLGKPLGCNDLFGRVKPGFQISVGKWFTPAVGARLNYGGLQLKDCMKASQDYQYLRADFLWNLLGKAEGPDGLSVTRWSVIPFVGVGLLHNRENGKKPFALSYGVQGQYRLSKRVAVLAEIGNMTTMRDFDGYGEAGKLGDHLLSASVGLSVTLGKVGWKRAVDARSYISRYEGLYDYATFLRDRNEQFQRQHEQDLLSLEQLRKILAIEGLLDKYGFLFEGDDKDLSLCNYPKNDYSGLNSLRARMKERMSNRRPPRVVDSVNCAGFRDTLEALENSDYFTLMRDGQVGIGAPVYFFFKLGTSHLINPSQWVNLDEVARIALKYGLSVKVVGAADSATGTEGINESLSRSRADCIAAELVKRGIKNEQISKVYDGGIDTYHPDEANRHTKIMLCF